MNIEKIMSLEQNTHVEGVFVITEISSKPFKEKEGFFLTFILQDKTGRIYGKIWENADTAKKELKNDIVISISGHANLFSGKNQIIVESYSIISNYNLDDFMICSLKNQKDMIDELTTIMYSQLEDKDIKSIWESYHCAPIFFNKFITCPGGKGDVHHAYLYGLLEHTLGVIKNCIFYAEQFKEQHVNKSVLLMGAFLHDLGKIESYEYSVSIKMTDIGRLHGHVVLGYHSFVNKINCLNLKNKEELIKVLGHMILSHHGTFEQHTIQLPATLEAILLANADAIDADIIHVDKFLEKAVDGWTQFDNLRDRMYYFRKNEEIVFEEEEKKPTFIKRKSKSSELFTYKEE